MRKYIVTILRASFVASLLWFSASSALADNKVWTGQVMHVSTTNIKVENGEGVQTCDQVLSFLLVPKFNQVFSDDGNTTLQMTDIKPGMWVTIYYDQSALGARHADKIVVLHNGLQINT